MATETTSETRISTWTTTCSIGWVTANIVSFIKCSARSNSLWFCHSALALKILMQLFLVSIHHTLSFDDYHAAVNVIYKMQVDSSVVDGNGVLQAEVEIGHCSIYIPIVLMSIQHIPPAVWPSGKLSLLYEPCRAFLYLHALMAAPIAARPPLASFSRRSFSTYT